MPGGLKALLLVKWLWVLGGGCQTPPHQLHLPQFWWGEESFLSAHIVRFHTYRKQ